MDIHIQTHAIYLNNFRGRVVKVIMGLVVLIPFKAGVNSVEVSWLPWPVLVTPVIALPILILMSMFIVLSRAVTRGA